MANSKNRQITIPLDFYKDLNLDNEVEFSVEILKDLINQGYLDEELVKQFEIQNRKIKNAISNILEEADAIVAGEKPTSNLDDIFGSEN